MNKDFVITFLKYISVIFKIICGKIIAIFLSTISFIVHVTHYVLKKKEWYHSSSDETQKENTDITI